MSFKSDDTSDGKDNILDIPGMQLASTDQGYFGAFGSTYTDVAFALPYEGEFRFFLDPGCGYFYMLGAGSFTIFGIPLRGQVFLFHAPKEVFKTHPFTNYNTTSLLEDMRIRAMSEDVEEFLVNSQLKGIDDDIVVTGFLSTGAASYSVDWHAINYRVKAGITNYFYHSNDNNYFRTGLFSTLELGATLDVALFSVDVEGQVAFNLALAVPMGNFSDVMGSIAQSDFVMSGAFDAGACFDLFGLGKCCALFNSLASLSNQYGFRFEEATLSSCCGCNDR